MDEMRSMWDDRWEEALGQWSHLVMMRPPHWCFSREEAKEQGLEGSFAMIRLKDHRIVLDGSLIKQYGLDDYALEILAHEIGHHVYVPANLTDNGRMLTLVRKALTEKEEHAPRIMNLFADHLINYHLQSRRGLRMDDIYKKIQKRDKRANSSPVWNLYLGIYEKLYSLQPGELTQVRPSKDRGEQMERDSEMGAHIIRSYSGDWLEGAYSYAILFYPYLWEEEGKAETWTLIMDALKASEGCSGVGADLEAPPEDIDDEPLRDRDGINSADRIPDRSPRGEGPRQRYKSPRDYLDYLRQLDPAGLDINKALARYYKQISAPYLIPFPKEKVPQTEGVIPEGLESWDLGDNPGEIDWFGSLIRSPEIIPGMTTVKRVFAPDEGDTLADTPLDLYIGIDCSGSMGNPAINFSWPVLAGTIIAQSALRGGARVKVTLSGEPGSFMETEGFVRDPRKIMDVLVSYLGTGYAFGIPRLRTDFSRLRKSKTHILLLTDDDIFAMLGGGWNGEGEKTWDVARKALENCGGGGSLVLYSRPEYHKKEADILRKEGWTIHYVSNDEELSRFAKKFAAGKFGGKG